MVLHQPWRQHVNAIDRNELLLRFLDGNLNGDETKIVYELLRTDAQSRAFLQDVAEHAVMIADSQRTAIQHHFAGLQQPIDSYVRENESVVTDVSTMQPALRTTWFLAATILVSVMIGVTALAFLSNKKLVVARVVKVTGASQFFGSTGKISNDIQPGSSVMVGDTLESRSCDAWITMSLKHDATMTIAGNSAIRVPSSDASQTHFELLKGSIWFSPAASKNSEIHVIVTPTMRVEFRDALLNIQTSLSESIVRVHDGSATVVRLQDNSTIKVEAGHQVYVVLGDTSLFSSHQQPTPTTSWTMDDMKGQEVIFGSWLRPGEEVSRRLGATPLLWPLPDAEPVMLYAVAIAAWKCTDKPVRLYSNSILRFRGKTEKPQMVRFGVSTQKMYGVFAGKFECDVPAEQLGGAGDYWQVDLPLKDFSPLHPQLASTPEGLELTDVYALTIHEDVGLEITSIELMPSAINDARSNSD